MHAGKNRHKCVEAIGQTGWAGLQYLLGWNLEQPASLDCRYSSHSAAGVDSFMIQWLTTPGSQNDLRVRCFQLVRGHETILGAASLGQIAKDVPTTRDFDQFADPTYSADHRIIPLFEVDARVIPKRRGLARNSVDSLDVALDQSPRLVPLADQTPNLDDHAQNFLDRTLIEDQDRQVGFDQLAGQIRLNILEANH